MVERQDKLFEKLNNSSELSDSILALMTEEMQVCYDSIINCKIRYKKEILDIKVLSEIKNICPKAYQIISN